MGKIELTADQFNKIYSSRILRKDVDKILRRLNSDVRKDTKQTQGKLVNQLIDEAIKKIKELQ